MKNETKKVIFQDNRNETTVYDVGGGVVAESGPHATVYASLLDYLRATFQLDTSNIDALANQLNELHELCDEYGLDSQDVYDSTLLPIFGGDTPSDTYQVCSWSEDKIMWCGDSFRMYSVTDREDVNV